MAAQLTLQHALALIAAGFVAGVMNAIAGGGTLVTFPALIFAGLPSITANATSTIALLPAALASAAGYRKNITTVARWLVLFAPVSLAGGLLGGILLIQTPSRVFDALVPFLILFATILFMAKNSFSAFFGGYRTPRHESPPRTWLIGAAVFQFFIALYGGYFGAGIGILMLASLGILGFEDLHEMNTLKVLLGFLINVVAALYFAATGHVQWTDAAVMAVGTVAGGFFGAHFAQKIPQTWVRSAITAIGLVITAVMFIRTFA